MPGTLREKLDQLRGSAVAGAVPASPLSGESLVGANSVSRFRDSLHRMGRARSAQATEATRLRPAIASGERPPMLDDVDEQHQGWCLRSSRHPLASLVGVHATLAAPGRIETECSRHGASLGSRTPFGAQEAKHPGRILFLDLETTGLRGSGTLAWCVGFAWLERHDGQAVARVEQLLLESPEAEDALLARAIARIDSADLLVTFNGRSYDLPLLESRCVLQRRPAPPRRRDLDLLPPARRLFAAGASTLAALEGRLGRTRVEDIPGADVPRAWFDWLRFGESADVRRAVEHNRDDILSMVAILSWLLALAAGDGSAEAFASPVGHAEYLARRGDAAGALRRLGGSVAPDPEGPGLSSQHRRRARLLHALAGRSAARHDWEQLIAAGDPSPEPWEGMAKILEHDERDVSAAAKLVRQALQRVSSRSGRARLQLRLARLCRRLDMAAVGPPMASRQEAGSRDRRGGG